MSWVRSRVVAVLSAMAAAAAAVVGPPVPAVASLADSLHVELACVSAPLAGSATWEAHFRVVNTSGAAFEVPFGISNFFSPNPPFRGQPFNFPPGWQSVLVTFTDEQGHASWTLADETVRADAASPRCETKVSDVVVAGIPAVGNVLTMAGERVDLAVSGYDVTYRWFTDCDTTPVQVGTGRSYTVQAADAGERLGATITYARSNNVGLTISSACSDPVGVPPSATEAPGISALPKEGVELSLTGGSWSGTTPTTESVVWEVCASSTCAAAGADPTYTPDADDVGKTVRARVTRTNTFGSGTVTTAAVGPVRPAAAVAGTLIPGGVTFADTALGRSVVETVHYLNDTLDPVDIDDVRVSGADADGFAVVDHDCPVLVPVGGGCAIVIAFEPTGPGSFTAALHVDDGAGATATLSGRAGVAPAAGATPRVSGTPVVEQPLTVTDAAWSGAPSVDVVWEACTPLDCGPVGSGPTFTPGADELGDFIRAVVTATNDFGTDRVVTAAVGPVRSATPVPGTVLPRTVAFPDTVVGGTSSATVYYVNSTLDPVAVAPTIAAAQAAGFAVVGDDCDPVVTPGEQCAIGVRFQPAAEGAATAVLEVGDGATATLSGRALPPKGAPPPVPQPSPAGLSLGAARLDLGKARVGRPGRVRTMAITNTGGSPLVVQGVRATGKHRRDVVLSTTCPGDTLAPGTTCAVALRLKPSAPGRRKAALVVSSSAGAQTVALTGKGVRKRR